MGSTWSFNNSFIYYLQVFSNIEILDQLPQKVPPCNTKKVDVVSWKSLIGKKKQHTHFSDSFRRVYILDSLDQ